jgi:hypothetical protein
MPVGYVSSSENYVFFKNGFKTIKEAQDDLITYGAIQRHQAIPNSECIDCDEFIILNDSFDDFSQKILPDYIKC